MRHKGMRVPPPPANAEQQLRGPAHVQRLPTHALDFHGQGHAIGTGPNDRHIKVGVARAFDHELQRGEPVVKWHLGARDALHRRLRDQLELRQDVGGVEQALPFGILRFDQRRIGMNDQHPFPGEGPGPPAAVVVGLKRVIGAGDALKTAQPGQVPDIADGEEVIPLGAVPNSEIVVYNECGYFMQYKSDRYGFNNPDAIWDQSHFDLEPVLQASKDSEHRSELPKRQMEFR